MDGAAMNWMHKMAEKKNAVLVGSMMMKEEGKFYNRLIWMHPDGRFELYDKRHLFRMGNEHEHYTAGNSRIVFQLNEWKICPLICYDLRFPELFRGMNDQGVETILITSGWPTPRINHWRVLNQARAIENQAWVIACNEVGPKGDIMLGGHSMVVSPRGEIIAEAGTNEEVLYAEIDLTEVAAFRNEHPFQKDRFIR
jgi:predicted amidohydrolase